jgi:glycosyltransferase involved in cell wall biosynthesis
MGSANSSAAVSVPPKVSVVVPCFNLGEFLPEAIGSVLAQTFQDLEIVVVDDGSDAPATRVVLDRLAAPRTRLIRAPHGGPGAARNTGIRESAGSYVCPLDADDVLHPDWLARAVPVLDDDRDLAFVSCWTETFGEESWTSTPFACDLTALLHENVLPCTGLIRREALERVGGYDEELGARFEDWDLWLRLLEAGFHGTIVPEVLFRYRRRSQSWGQLAVEGALGRDPIEDILEKHAATYRRHLVELALLREAEILRLEREREELHRPDGIEAELVALRAEVEAARAAVAPFEEVRAQALDARSQRLRIALEAAAAARAAAGAECARLTAALDAAERERAARAAEAQALRSSLSWQLTAPMRQAYEWLRRRRG